MTKKLLVCTQLRHPPNPHSCGNSGSRALIPQLQELLREAGASIEVEASACMSMCIHGPNTKLLPIGKTWHHVDGQALGEIVAFCKLNQ